MAKDKDIAVLEKMARIYCKGQHHTKKGLCPECQEVLDYAVARREKCRYGDNKPFCAHCQSKCYKPSIQEEVRKIMRYAGPRSIFYVPHLVILHAIEGIKHKKKAKK